ncbi:MAG TPA: hypothetical protein VGN98_08715 [Tianweitania sediminis]|jgi:hypothetical protein|nr:hypothetical protein [Tianweitania sediminis]
MKLPLAVDIAEAAAEAETTPAGVNIPNLAKQLVAGHPEAEASVEEVEEAVEESIAKPQQSDFGGVR